MEYIIRLAREDDLDSLVKLKHAVWDSTYRGIYPDRMIDDYDYEKHLNKFKKIMSNPDVELFVVESDGKLIGYMEYGVPIRPFKEYEQEIGLLYVLKEYQGMGIGRELFDLAYRKIKENGYDEFFISCNKYNVKAQGFYEKMGGELINTDEDNEDKTIPQKTFLYKINR